MSDETFDPIAAKLLFSYLDASAYSKDFRDEHETPPTSMSKVHHMRSVLIAGFTKDEDYVLGQNYVEFGRVEFKDVKSGRQLLLRSESACRIESPGATSLTLFPVEELVEFCPVEILAYEFTKSGLKLSTRRSVQRRGSRRLYAYGGAVEIGLWPYSTTEPVTEGFSQTAADPFSEIGSIDFDQESAELK